MLREQSPVSSSPSCISSNSYLHNPDNHDGMITHLEPDVLESEVKWALGSPLEQSPLKTKLVEVMEFQWSYFKS